MNDATLAWQRAEALDNAIRAVERSRKRARPATAMKGADPMLLAQALVRLRNRAGLRQQDVAKLTGYHRPIVARIESGTSIPDLSTIATLALAYGVQVSDVILEAESTMEVA